MKIPLEVPHEVALVGKGASIDSLDWSTVPAFRACLNQTVYVVPDPSVAFAVDRQSLEIYAETPLPCVAVIPDRRRAMLPDDRAVTWTREEIPTLACCTATVAIQWLAKRGARRFVMCGFDTITRGDQSRSRATIPLLRNSGEPRYERFTVPIMKALERVGARVEWRS